MIRTRTFRDALPPQSRGRAVLAVALAVTCPPTLAGDERCTPVARSEACAPCHAAGGKGTFEQWLASPYSDRDGGLPCQGCHREDTLPLGCRTSSPTDGSAKTAPGRPSRRAAELRVMAGCDDTGGVTVEVAVCNLGAGHELPTGGHGAAVILVVEGFAPNGVPLTRREGPILPEAADVFSGRPGVVYAAGRSGLPPFATDVTRYLFAGPCTNETRIEARLVSRRSWSGLMTGALRETVISSASTTLR